MKYHWDYNFELHSVEITPFITERWIGGVRQWTGFFCIRNHEMQVNYLHRGQNKPALVLVDHSEIWEYGKLKHVIRK